MADRAGRVALHYAALDNDVARLVALGTDLNAEDAQCFRPLHLAAQEHALEAAALLAAGAEVDGVNRSAGASRVQRGARHRRAGTVTVIRQQP